jgi:hypothetical protein
MKTLRNIQSGLPSYREILRVGSSLLMVVGQKLPFLKPCAAFLAEARAVQGFMQFAVPAGVTYMGTHSLSGASVAVVTAGTSTNPTVATSGANFQWFCQSNSSHQFGSVSVAGLPPGLTFTYGKPISSITGKPTTPGNYTVSLVGWENSNQKGDKTATYKLAITVSGAGTPLAPEIQIEQPAGSNLTDGVTKKSFGTVVVGKASTSKVFTITNTGTETLTGLSLTRKGTMAKEFSAGGLAVTSLAPGAKTTFKVQFKPAAKGTRFATIQVKSNDSDENPFDIKVTGAGA